MPENPNEKKPQQPQKPQPMKPQQGDKPEPMRQPQRAPGGGEEIDPKQPEKEDDERLDDEGEPTGRRPRLGDD